ncbi:DUF2637 domain-containing protein [Streptomyces sp. NPDC056652]|uniref:DUF2637 domain-containing protein n=1 Tax=Streptomyces sp. NPDC056652 TaxID=3345893 RepID=UPI00367EBCBC
MNPIAVTDDQIRSAERVLSAGTWTITAGAILFSVLTVTPLVQRVTPEGWEPTAPVLPLVVDAAVVIVIRLDSVVSRLGGSGGRWPAVLRWLTGAMTLLLNVGDSALKRDLVGVAVHAVAPLLLIVTAEAGLAYRRAIGRALDRIAREQADAHAAQEAAHKERERLARQEREAERQAAQEAQERAENAARDERERAAREAREEREHEARIAREERDHAARMAREAAEREEERERQKAERERQLRADEQARASRERERIAAEQRTARERREAREKAERERLEKEAAAHRERLRVAMSTGEQTGGADQRMGEEEARALIVLGLSEGATQRQMVDATGWSAGWVAARCKEAREGRTAELDKVAI